ncbi:UbiA family prenyltransferase [Picrophilus oshimae]|uniref:Digeranylgeranylglyceryl phosphate synthase n=1 Tax=Picrophilus torridus (strain ATCC 700027 / DSM 9790 / JCM 10055 / NBRC 100828 / KAW 2/3) TaxID=1122961 RepID=Q6L2N5_PICTO|nr:UbiA family prenyltransferase [Picrophilus oshimae]AAT42767.1 prenyltransferase [Picrophilus oshimae DSM 9789]
MSLKSWFKIIRPVNGFMGLISIYIVGFIDVNFKLPHYLKIITLGALSVFFVTSGGNIINDIKDRDLDKINHPSRPIPSGEISIKSAYVVFIIMFIIAIILSFFISLYAVLVVIFAEALLTSYEIKTKNLGLIGNFTVSLLIGFIFIFGGIILNTVFKMILLFLLAFFSNVSREIMKDIEDVNGDLNRETFPRVYGIKKAEILASFFVILTVSISILPYYFKILTIYYVYAVIIDDILFILSMIIMYRNVSESQQVSKIAMIVGMISFLVGGIN